MDWTSLITNVGFSGAVCIGLIMYMHKLIEKEREENKEFITAISNNTAAIAELKLLIQQLLPTKKTKGE